MDDLAELVWKSVGLQHPPASSNRTTTTPTPLEKTTLASLANKTAGSSPSSFSLTPTPSTTLTPNPSPTSTPIPSPPNPSPLPYSSSLLSTTTNIHFNRSTGNILPTSTSTATPSKSTPASRPSSVHSFEAPSHSRSSTSTPTPTFLPFPSDAFTPSLSNPRSSSRPIQLPNLNQKNEEDPFGQLFSFNLPVPPKLSLADQVQLKKEQSLQQQKPSHLIPEIPPQPHPTSSSSLSSPPSHGGFTLVETNAADFSFLDALSTTSKKTTNSTIALDASMFPPTTTPSTIPILESSPKSSPYTTNTTASRTPSLPHSHPSNFSLLDLPPSPAKNASQPPHPTPLDSSTLSFPETDLLVDVPFSTLSPPPFLPPSHSRPSTPNTITPPPLSPSPSPPPLPPHHPSTSSSSISTTFSSPLPFTSPHASTSPTPRTFTLLSTLIELGYDPVLAEAALEATGNDEDIHQALDWMEQRLQPVRDQPFTLFEKASRFLSTTQKRVQAKMQHVLLPPTSTSSVTAPSSTSSPMMGSPTFPSASITHHVPSSMAYSPPLEEKQRNEKEKDTLLNTTTLKETFQGHSSSSPPFHKNEALFPTFSATTTTTTTSGRRGSSLPYALDDDTFDEVPEAVWTEVDDLKAQGNASVQLGQYGQALTQYETAFRHFLSTNKEARILLQEEAGVPRTSLPHDFPRSLPLSSLPMVIVLFNNMALCCLKLGNPKQCVTVTQWALEVWERWLTRKTSHRMGVGRKGQGGAPVENEEERWSGSTHMKNGGRGGSGPASSSFSSSVHETKEDEEKSEDLLGTPHRKVVSSPFVPLEPPDFENQHGGRRRNEGSLIPGNEAVERETEKKHTYPTNSTLTFLHEKEDDELQGRVHEPEHALPKQQEEEKKKKKKKKKIPTLTVQDHVKTWFRLGTGLEELERWDEAKRAYQTVMSLDPHHPYARARLHRCMKPTTLNLKNEDLDLGDRGRPPPPSRETPPPHPPLSLPKPSNGTKEKKESVKEKESLSTFPTPSLSMPFTQEKKRDEENEEETSLRLQLKDELDLKLQQWSQGKETNLRALLSSLHTVVWSELQSTTPPCTLAQLITPAQVKLQYMKAIGKVHPDKVTMAHQELATSIFTILNKAWDAFKEQNQLN
ncbi:hypothetical protein HMI54_003152 [Coelomomyces lativittatus]|nr:hypothetical protein HMI56_001674 [Coelomomyces lativittatus]KAJ1508547.1 hypothetical protein HMI54_003152 [Coelomomyces lativittatus]